MKDKQWRVFEQILYKKEVIKNCRVFLAFFTYVNNLEVKI